MPQLGRALEYYEMAGTDYLSDGIQAKRGHGGRRLQSRPLPSSYTACFTCIGPIC
jgi:hypothetical protein